MRVQDLAALLVFILIIRFECIGAVPTPDDDFTNKLEHRLQEGQRRILEEEQLLEELVKRIEQKAVATGQGQNGQNEPQEPGYDSQGRAYGQQEAPYGTRDSGYGSRGSSYGTWDSKYGAQESGYGTADSGYETRDSGYGTGDSGYGTRESAYNPDSANNAAYGEVIEARNTLGILLERLEHELDGKDGVDTALSDLDEYQSQRGIDDNDLADELQKNRTDANINKQEERIKKLVKKVLKKVAKKIFEKEILLIEAKLLRLTSRVLARIAEKTGIRLLARLGLKAGEKAAIKTAKAVALKLGTSTEIAAETGPGFPFVEAAMLAFDCLSIGLDIGDAGGYMKMCSKAEYMEMKSGIDKEMKKALEAEGCEYPAVVGPLDKLSDDEYEASVNQAVTDMLDIENGNPELEKVINKIKSDLESKQLTEEDIDNDVNLDSYAELFDSAEVFAIVCISQDGKVVDTSNALHCSYKDREACDSSYTWPLKEDSDEIYAEYKTEVYGGSCVAASYALRAMCKDNDLPYDSEIGICTITEKYCKMKGADWKFNDEIKQNDCAISGGQDFAETLFGTTIVRGLKQIFDPSQYEKCKPKEIDDGYFCRSIFCPVGEEQWANAGICYPKCKQGYHPFGCCICSPDCQTGWTDDGATCRRAGYCEEDKDHDGALCYPKCKSGYKGVGPVCWEYCPDDYTDIGLVCSKGGEVVPKKSRPADKKPCPEGMRDDGTSCWLDTYGRGVGRIPDKEPCPSGMRDDGTSCWLDTYGRGAGRMPDKGSCPPGLRDDGTSCWSDAHIYGKGCCCTIWGCCSNCKPGYNDDGCTCRKTDVGIKLTLFQRQTCKSDEDKCLALCYPKCKANFHPAGCNLCEPTGGPGIKVTLAQRYRCKDDEELNGALCYPKCKAGFHPVGCCLCEPDDKPGIKVTLFERQYCKATEKNVAGICWSPCPAECKDDGALCRVPIQTKKKGSYGRGVGTPDTVIKTKGAAYGRGVGKPAVHIRAKNRVIPFSTKNNKR